MTPDPLKRLRAQLRAEESELLEDLATARGWKAPLTESQLAELRAALNSRDLDALHPEIAGADPLEVTAARLNPEKVVDRYVLIDPIGRGGASTVWRAWDGQLHRWVAVKIPREDVSDRFRQRFLREARVAAGLKHPNLVAVHDAGEVAGKLYLVMELIHGRPLEVAGGYRRIAEVMRKVADGVNSAHALGIVHRDLKPANILVDDAGEPHVVDFGLAHLDRGDVALTQTGMAMGTPLYMAPEQVRGDSKAVSARTDVYALGVILYELLAGRTPAVGETSAALFDQILNDDPRPPRHWKSDVPADLEAICLKAIEKSPHGRYASAGDLAADLDRHLKGQPIVARPSTLLTRAWRRVRRRSVSLAIASAVLTALLIAVGVSLKAGRVSDQLALETRAADLSAAYFDLIVQTVEPMQRLEEYWQTGAIDPDVAVHLEAVEGAVKTVSARHPGLGLPGAYLGLAKLYAGDEKRAVDEIRAACNVSSDDPFPQVLLAKARFARFVRDANIRGYNYHLEDPMFAISEAAETEAMNLALKEAVEAVDRALKYPIWAHLRHGREYLRYAEAGRMLARKDFDGAAKRFAELQSDPRLEAEARLLRGLALIHQGKILLAAETLEGKGGRTWSKALCLAGGLHIQAAIEERHADRDPEPQLRAAIEDYNATLKRAPKYFDAFVTRAVANIFLGKYRLERGEDPSALFDLALADSDTAVQLLDGAISRQSRAEACAEIARIEMSRGRDGLALLERAVADLDEVVRLDQTPESHIRRADRLTLKGQAEAQAGKNPAASYESAIADYDFALKSGPLIAAFDSRGILHAEVGNLLMGAGENPTAEYEKAIADFEEVIRREPTQAEAYCNRGLARVKIGDYLKSKGGDARPAYGQAIVDLDHAIGIKDDPSFRNNRALAYYHRALTRAVLEPEAGEDIERAITDMNSAVGSAPESFAFRVSRGDIYVDRVVLDGNLGRSIEESSKSAYDDFTAAIKIIPSRFEPYVKRGCLLDTLGRLGEAIADLEKAASLQPGNDYVRQKLEELKARK